MVTLRRKIYKLEELFDTQKHIVMKERLFSAANLLLIILFCFSFVFTQSKKKERPIHQTAPTGLRAEELLPEIKEYAFVIKIDRDSNITLSIQKSEDSNVLSNTSNTKPLSDFFSGFSKLQNSKTRQKPKNSPDQIVIIKADSALKYNEIINVVQSSRISFTQKIKVEISKDYYIFVPPKQDEKTASQIKPNPLTLIVKLDGNMNLTLNNEAVGSLNDTSLLTSQLKQIFKDRENYGAFREGSNEVEQTLYIKAPLSAGFSDVIKLVNILKDAGANPIGLQVDDLDL